MGPIVKVKPIGTGAGAVIAIVTDKNYEVNFKVVSFFWEGLILAKLSLLKGLIWCEKNKWLLRRGLILRDHLAFGKSEQSGPNLGNIEFLRDQI